MAILSPYICTSGRRLPCAYLAELAANPTVVPVRSSLACRRALIVAALQLRIAEALQETPKGAGALGVNRDLFSAIGDKSVFAPLEVRVFGEGRDAGFGQRPNLYALLSAITDSLLSQALRWAPPVLSVNDKAGTARVVASQLLMAIHRHRSPRQPVTGYQLRVQSSHHATLDEVVFDVREAFEKLVSANKSLIARSAGSVSEAMFLTGLGRTRIYELRKTDKRAA